MSSFWTKRRIKVSPQVLARASWPEIGWALATWPWRRCPLWRPPVVQFGPGCNHWNDEPNMGFWTADRNPQNSKIHIFSLSQKIRAWKNELEVGAVLTFFWFLGIWITASSMTTTRWQLTRSSKWVHRFLPRTSMACSAWHSMAWRSQQEQKTTVVTGIEESNDFSVAGIFDIPVLYESWAV